jgi:hypothetical protein
MVTVHRAFGLRFVIYSNDHEPAHVHVTGNGCEAKVQLVGDTGVSLVWHFGFKHAELRKMLIEVERKRDFLIAEWERIHG